VVRIFPPGGLDPVLDGGVGDKGAMVAPEVPASIAIGQTIFGDQTDGSLLKTTGVETIR
jgi:hypothetical protein